MLRHYGIHTDIHTQRYAYRVMAHSITNYKSNACAYHHVALVTTISILNIPLLLFRVKVILVLITSWTLFHPMVLSEDASGHLWIST